MLLRPITIFVAIIVILLPCQALGLVVHIKTIDSSVSESLWLKEKCLKVNWNDHFFSPNYGFELMGFVGIKVYVMKIEKTQLLRLSWSIIYVCNTNNKCILLEP